MKAYAIGVEIGGTKLQVALGSNAGEIEARSRGAVDAEAGATGILEWLEREVATMIESSHASGKNPVSIGIGFGGPVDSATGKVLTSHQIEGWKGVALRSWFEDRFKLPTVVANDANAAGWAEYCLGAGQGTRNFCYMNIGSGIGGALVFDGQLYNGQGLGAAEIGHTYVPDWTRDTLGCAAKLEDICSGWSIEKRIRSWKGIDRGTPLWTLTDGCVEQLSCPILAQAANEGDQVALGEIHRIAQSVGLALSNLVTLTHPECIALGGGVSLMGPVLLEAVEKTLLERCFTPYQNSCKLLPCQLEEDVVTVGALLLAGIAKFS